jgi:hypothetical protein
MHVGRFVGTLALSVNHRRGVSCGPMRQLLATCLILAGVLAMGSPYLPVGIIMVMLGIVLLQRVTVRAEETFIGVLMILGALGALVPFAQYAQALIGQQP